MLASLLSDFCIPENIKLLGDAIWNYDVVGNDEAVGDDGGFNDPGISFQRQLIIDF